MVTSGVLMSSCINFLYAQDQQDATLKLLTTSIEKAISRGHEHKDCRNFKSSVFSIFITFSAEAKVEDVFFSNSTYCSAKTIENTGRYIKANIDKLNIDKSQFGEKYIAIVAYVLPQNRSETTLNTVPEGWARVFEDIDYMRFQTKSLKYCIPIGIYLLPRVEN